jgi:hypothetical protein
VDSGISRSCIAAQQGIAMRFLRINRAYRLPRIWSNRELAKFAHLFDGHVVNVSGWVDIDKEGGHYRDYFRNGASYSITNYKTEARGFQGGANEIYLDLTDTLPENLAGRFDVVFNHTTMEHIFEVSAAFANLCRMSRDIVILVVPFLQPVHADYGDYWRFTPLAVQRLFEQQGLEVLYLSWNCHTNASVYIFAIASRQPSKWAGFIGSKAVCCRGTSSANEAGGWVGCGIMAGAGRMLAEKIKALGAMLSGKK